MPPTIQIRAAIAVHHTDCDDGAWDGAAAEKSLSNDDGAAVYRMAYVWVDPTADADTKAAYKGIHHDVDGEGNVGDANTAACSAIIAGLNGGRGGFDIPSGDRQGVWDHAAAHLRDANMDDPKYEPPGLRGIGGAFEERAAFRTALIELRADGEGKPPHIVGHAAVYSQWSQDLGGFKERVMPGAFSKALNGSDIRALFNHDPNYLLGLTAAETLSLADEKKGLHWDATPPDTQTIRDLVLAPMARKDLTQCSFSFLPVEDEWRAPKLTDGLYERDLYEVQLFDVSAVTFPAYDQTDVGLRSRLAGALGLDLAGLTSFFARTYRGVANTTADQALLRDAIALLSSHLPDANGGEPSGANGGKPSRAGASASPSRARLLRDLEHRLRVDRVAVTA